MIKRTGRRPLRLRRIADTSAALWTNAEAESTSIGPSASRGRGVRGLARMVVVLGALLAGAATAATPAHAATGGGCRTTSAVRACVSFSSPNVIGDFYLISGPDAAVCKASITIFRDGIYTSATKSYNLTYQGHYGSISFNADVRPNKDQSAFARVYIYFCDWTLHYYADSPIVHFIA